MSSEPAYDVVVLGGGVGGYVAAIRASQLGLRAAVVEREALGGICLNWGCIPSKALLRSAEVLSLFNHAKDFGITVGEVQADYGAAIKRCLGIVDRQVKGVGFLMRKNKIDVHSGEGRLNGASQVIVKDGQGAETPLSTRNVIVASGSRVRTIRGIEIDGHVVASSREVWSIQDLPKRVVVLGGGPIGVEFATVFQAYGCEVTVVEMLPRLLPLEDADMSKVLTRAFTKRGIKVLTSTKVDRVEVQDGKAQVHVAPANEGDAGASDFSPRHIRKPDHQGQHSQRQRDSRASRRHVQHQCRDRKRDGRGSDAPGPGEAQRHPRVGERESGLRDSAGKDAH